MKTYKHDELKDSRLPMHSLDDANQTKLNAIRRDTMDAVRYGSFESERNKLATRFEYFFSRIGIKDEEIATKVEAELDACHTVAKELKPFARVDAFAYNNPSTKQTISK